MPKFIYTALNADNKPINGTIESVDRNTALETIRKQHLKPINLRQATRKAGLHLSFLKSHARSKDLVIFTRQLSTMVSAGVPLLRALTTLQAQSESKALRETLALILKDVQGGMALGDAFAKHPDTFNDVYVNMVRAGEAAGILDDILKRLAMQQEKNDSMRKKIKSAMTYPVVLLVITIGAFFGLMFFVMPQIGKIITDLSSPGTELPALTQVMLGISSFVQERWYIVLLAAILVIYFVRRYLKTPTGKAQFHELILRVPGVGMLVKKIAVARFARTFAALMGAGVNVLEALEVTGRAVGNLSYKRELEKAAEAIKNGAQLSETLASSKYFPAIVPQMLAVGEETGQTDIVLVKVADFYEEEVDVMIDGLSSIIEPVMIAIMGSMVGLIAASVMGPISGLANTIE
jgi:type IV pilus assembly protein PilC